MTEMGVRSPDQPYVAYLSMWGVVVVVSDRGVSMYYYMVWVLS